MSPPSNAIRTGSSLYTRRTNPGDGAATEDGNPVYRRPRDAKIAEASYQSPRMALTPRHTADTFAARIEEPARDDAPELYRDNDESSLTCAR
jgi:hypothetical protein